MEDNKSYLSLDGKQYEEKLLAIFNKIGNFFQIDIENEILDVITAK